VNWSASDGADVPLAVVIVRSIVPIVSEGDTTTHEVDEVQLIEAALTEPNWAVVAPTTNPDPVTATDVPPLVGPVSGTIPVTAEGKVKLSEANADGPPLLETV
jgi:hypothetical protein